MYKHKMKMLGRVQIIVKYLIKVVFIAIPTKNPFKSILNELEVHIEKDNGILFCIVNG